MDIRRFELESGRITCAPAREFERRSIARWGAGNATSLIGRHHSLRDALDRIICFAASESPVLIVGETGAGKELLARALYLFSPRSRKPFVVVNCAQYGGGQPIVSELFGHRKGSFTGADRDHRGLFEVADQGVVFLDEVGELPLGAQSMLLRTVAEGEVVPVGGVRRKRISVRIVAATNRNLKEMVAEGNFREDLYYRLQGMVVRVPPLRERGADYELIADYWLGCLNEQHETEKRLTGEVRAKLGTRRWSGNIRELKNTVEAGYYVSRSDVIGLDDIGDMLEEATRGAQFKEIMDAQARWLCERMIASDGSFWSRIHDPYMKRNLNRTEVQAVIASALSGSARGSYKRMLLSFGVDESDYLKAMDFLRHHRLKPDRVKRGK